MSLADTFDTLEAKMPPPDDTRERKQWLKLVRKHRPGHVPYDGSLFAEILKLVAEQGLSVPAACGVAGILPVNFDGWVEHDPDLFDRLQVARLKRMALLETGLMASANSAQVQARIFALKNADPSIWRADPDVQHTNIAANITIITGVPDAIPLPQEVAEATKAISRAPLTIDADPVRAEHGTEDRDGPVGSG